MASRCNKDGIVFIYISGHQFPLKPEVRGESAPIAAVVSLVFCYRVIRHRMISIVVQYCWMESLSSAEDV